MKDSGLQFLTVHNQYVDVSSLVINEDFISLACCKLRHISTVLNGNLTKWWILRSRALQQEMNSDLRAVDLGAPAASWEITEPREMTRVAPKKTQIGAKFIYEKLMDKSDICIHASMCL